MLSLWPQGYFPPQGYCSEGNSFPPSSIFICLSSPLLQHITSDLQTGRCEPLRKVTQSSVRDCVLYLDVHVYMKIHPAKTTPRGRDTVTIPCNTAGSPQLPYFKRQKTGISILKEPQALKLSTWADTSTTGCPKFIHVFAVKPLLLLFDYIVT